MPQMQALAVLVLLALGYWFFFSGKSCEGCVEECRIHKFSMSALTYNMCVKQCEASGACKAGEMKMRLIPLDDGSAKGDTGGTATAAESAAAEANPVPLLPPPKGTAANTGPANPAAGKS